MTNRNRIMGRPKAGEQLSRAEIDALEKPSAPQKPPVNREIVEEARDGARDVETRDPPARVRLSPLPTFPELGRRGRGEGDPVIPHQRNNGMHLGIRGHARRSGGARGVLQPSVSLAESTSASMNAPPTRSPSAGGLRLGSLPPARPPRSTGPHTGPWPRRTPAGWSRSVTTTNPHPATAPSARRRPKCETEMRCTGTG